MWARLTRCWVLGLALCACASGPRPLPAHLRPAWPPPPQRARVRWLASFPDQHTQPARGRGVLSRVLDVALGLDEPPPTSPLLLARPFGVAVLGEELVISDPDGPAVLRVAWRRGESRPIVCPGRPWETPLGVAGGPEGSILVADAGARAIVRVHRSGACDVLGLGALERPTDVAALRGLVYAVDPPRHQVVVLGLDGREVRRIGARGEGAGEFNYPTALARRPDGNLSIVDVLNFRVQVLSGDGQPLQSLGWAGDGEGGLGRPKGVAVDERGRTYVSDAQHDVVVVFGPKGTFELAVGPEGLAMPAGVATGEGLLFVADTQHGRIQIYELLEDEP